ncbi:hypothetical protein [Kutzneria albida]|uniref:Uncharacterized protein n=1 Tax=Kutzneria albida DSM 43870 TaxID=1449976 RepID=W5WBW6_9PSEU|nr:hypothetical protein [Kutzneria albida]AHH98638.1 hypothetical protein KALB_5276 [Kutzneria albida DSM 43870]
MATTEFDLGTVLVSAGVSVGVSTLAGLVVTGIRVGRETRVKRRLEARDEARDQVHEIVGEVLVKVIKFQAGLAEGRDWESTHWIEDYIWASRILTASRPLGRLRRILIHWQLRWLVGPLAFSLAEATPEPDPHLATGQALWWQIKSSREIESAQQRQQLFRPGGLETILRGERDSRDVRLLKGILSWLARSW